MAQYDDDDLAEDTGMTLHDLYAELLLKDELIITVPTADIDSVKGGLISIKGKENSKLRAKGMPVDNNKLTVTVLPAKEDTQAGFSRVHLILAKRKTYNIAKIEAPEDF